MVKTYRFRNVYVLTYGSAAGPLENEGPLHNKFDVYYDDLYCKQSSYEHAEQQLLRSAINEAVVKANIRMDDIEVMVGGDLLNQLETSSYFMKDVDVPFIGVYSACATSVLSLINVGLMIDNGNIKKGIAFTSSHFCNAEKQFRFPNEYGSQKKETTTSTATGAGAVLLTYNKHQIKLTDFTIGRVIDLDEKNVNDFGSIMAVAAYDTLKNHLINTKTNPSNYDLIITGDLGVVGLAMLKSFIEKDGIEINNLDDCGLRLYDIDKQNVFCGASGCASSILVLCAEILKRMENRELNKVLLIATGALLSPVAVFQKGSIPCIAHALCFERCE